MLKIDKRYPKNFRIMTIAISYHMYFEALKTMVKFKNRKTVLFMANSVKMWFGRTSGRRFPVFGHFRGLGANFSIFNVHRCS